MTTPAEIAALLRSLEEQLLQPGPRKDAAVLNLLLAEDFREFGSSGRIYTKAEIIATLAEESPARLELIDFDCCLVAATVALVTYRSIRTIGGAVSLSLRSSTWIFAGDRWQMLFHQGTRIPEGAL